MLLNQDFTIASNTDNAIRFTVISESTGLPIPSADIEGASWGITPLEQDVAPLITKDLISGGITVPEDGVILVALSASDTVDLSGEFSHELRLKDSLNTRCAARGKLSVKYQIINNPL